MTEKDRKISVVLAGGGTAGHTSPLIATASALQRLDPDVQITCVGTARGLENQVVPAAGLDLELIPPVPMPRKPNLDLFKLPLRLRAAVQAARKILDEAEAQAVVGFGGYVSTPVYLAARQKRIAIFVHEQNAKPGLANKLAARFATGVFSAFPGTQLPGAEFLGMPVRAQIAELAQADRFDRAEAQRQARAAFGLATELPVVLVSGGSQGARSLNRATEQATDELLARGVQILHVWGPKNFPDDAEPRTNPQSGARYVPVAYVDDMATAYAASDLMVARSGAGTVVETAMVGLPTILVPLPIGNGEQALNAEPVVQAGAAVLVPDAELNDARLLAEVEALLDRRAEMSRAGRDLMRADAADELARRVLAAIPQADSTEGR